MSRRRGRPRSDRLALVEQVATILRAEPDLSAAEVQRRVRGRRDDVLRVVRILRPAGEPRHDAATPVTPFPNRESGKNGATGDPDSREDEQWLLSVARDAAYALRNQDDYLTRDEIAEAIERSVADRPSVRAEAVGGRELQHAGERVSVVEEHDAAHDVGAAVAEREAVAALDVHVREPERA